MSWLIDSIASGLAWCDYQEELGNHLARQRLMVYLSRSYNSLNSDEDINGRGDGYWHNYGDGHGDGNGYGDGNSYGGNGYGDGYNYGDGEGNGRTYYSGMW